MTEMDKEKVIYVFADFLDFNNELLGTIYVSNVRGKELFSFEYSADWLEKGTALLDPDLSLFKGRQYVNDDKDIFGMFADSCPDRWGRRLMNRKEELRAQKAGEKPTKLMESDYLLGVYDEARMGGLRFKTDLNGDFLSDDKEYTTPPWTSLRQLEQASYAFENEGGDDKWLRQLLAPGSSLGGARPKASVIAPDGSLWIAKFPSKHDEFDSGAWEMVVHDLAGMCGLNVPEAKAEKFSKLGTTFLVRRFDRNMSRRIHFSSAMTLLGKKDGADSSDGSSYLEMASFIKANGASPQKDLQELWKRIVFYMAVSNTDDHFRNHGFLLAKNGWVLSPLYDVNPDIYGEYLSLNVDSYSSRIDFEVAVSVSPTFGIEREMAKEIVKEVKETVNKNWVKLAEKQGISHSEIERMRPAFER